jgi:HK97 family phage portal protein
MSVLGNIGKTIASWFRPTSSLTWNIGTREVYADVNAQKAIDSGFNANTAVYSIVMKDAQKFGSIPRYVYDAKLMEEKAYSEGSVLRNDLSVLLNRPNDDESQDAFFAKVRASYKVSGEAFIWLNRGDVRQSYDPATNSFIDRDSKDYMRQPVLEMYVLPPSRVNPVPDPGNVFGGVLGYIFDLDGAQHPLRKEDIIHWKSTTLNWDATMRTHLRGMPALTPGYKSLQNNNDATDAATRMYQNDGAKGVLSNESMGSMTPTQQSQVKNLIDTKINNNDVKGAVAALQGKWAYHAINGSVDMQLLEAKKFSWQELSFLFDVPYELFDPETTFANKEQAQKGWVSNSIIPACKQLDGELNRMLLVAFGLENKAFIAADYSELPEMQLDLAAMATALAPTWWLTPNEKRMRMEEEPIEDPQMDEVWVPSGITPLSQMNDAAEMERETQELINSQIEKDDKG